MNNSSIIALSIVSAMDINEVKEGFTYTWKDENPHEFMDILYRFGMDTRTMYEVQTEVTHRTKLGRMVTCDRYVGLERTDPEWIASGYASREACDKAKGSALLNDLYRMKGQVA